MRKIKFLFILWFLSLASVTKAQTQITGLVRCGEAQYGNPLVVLLQKTQIDTVLSQSVYTNAQGFFQFSKVGAGTYLVRVSLQNISKYYPGIVNIRPGSGLVNLNTIDLPVPSVILEGAQITATLAKPLFEQDRGKLIFNVENSINNVGSNALEALQRIPGVFVDPSGGIQIGGQAGLTIKVNGRLLNLGSADRSELLRNIDVSQVRRIEVSTTPSSAQDAGGGAGIIDIQLKKGLNLGLNGNLNVTRRQSGFVSRNSTALALNYGDEKWSIYANGNYSKRDAYDSLTVRRFIPSVDTLIYQQANNRYPYRTISANTGASYQLTSKSEIGLAYTTSSTEGKTDGASIAGIGLVGSRAYRTTTAINDYRNTFRSSTVNVNYLFKPDSIGSKFSANFDNAWYRIGNRQISSVGEAKGGQLAGYSRNGTIANVVELTSADAQYFHHIDTTWIFKGGVKWARSLTTNDSNYEVLRNGQVITEADKSRSYLYSESIGAAFLEVERVYRKYVFITGLRAEHTSFLGNTVNPTETLVNYNRTDLFPFIFASRHITKNQEVSLVYSRRIDRPSFNDLNPLIIYYDPYTYTSGNPRLVPQFTGKLELTYNISRLPVLKVGYTRIRRALTGVTYQNDTSLTTFKTVDNIASRELFNVSVIVPVRIREKFLSTNFFSYGWNRFNGVYVSSPINFSRNSFNYYNNTTYTFANGLILEAGGFYNHGGIFDLFNLSDIWAVNFGVQKTFFRKKLTSRLNVTDAFFSQKNRYSFQQENIDIQARQVTDTRAISLSLTYRFGIRSKSPSARSSSIEMEQSRVKPSEH